MFLARRSDFKILGAFFCEAVTPKHPNQRLWLCICWRRPPAKYLRRMAQFCGVIQVRLFEGNVVAAKPAIQGRAFAVHPDIAFVGDYFGYERGASPNDIVSLRMRRLTLGPGPATPFGLLFNEISDVLVAIEDVSGFHRSAATQAFLSSLRSIFSALRGPPPPRACRFREWFSAL